MLKNCGSKASSAARAFASARYRDADDAVQEAWLRLARTDAAAIDNLAGWLTTGVSRVCLDQLRSRSARRETSDVGVFDELIQTPGTSGDPEAEALLADSLGSALQLVLDALRPAERIAFVLPDVFGVPFDEIGAVLGRSPSAAKQLASRARRRVQKSSPPVEADSSRQRAVVDAFLVAARAADFDALVAMLDPNAVLVADPAAVAMGSPPRVVDAAAVAGAFSGRANTAQVAIVDGAFGLAWAPGGQPKVVWNFLIEEGIVREIEMLADLETFAELDLVLNAD